MGSDRRTTVSRPCTRCCLCDNNSTVRFFCSLLNVHCLLKMDFCLCICKGNSRHIHKYQADSISWISRFIDIRILFCYRSFMLFHAYMQVDIMYALKVAESRCLWNPKLGVRTAIVHRSRNKSFSRSSFRVCIFKNFLFLDSRYSILDPRVSKLEHLDIRDARIEFRGSSRDCQLTFDRYRTLRKGRDGSKWKAFTKAVTKQQCERNGLMSMGRL